MEKAIILGTGEHRPIEPTEVLDIANIPVSEDADNQLDKRTDGLFVPPSELEFWAESRASNNGVKASVWTPKSDDTRAHAVVSPKGGGALIKNLVAGSAAKGVNAVQLQNDISGTVGGGLGSRGADSFTAGAYNRAVGSRSAAIGSVGSAYGAGSTVVGTGGIASAGGGFTRGFYSTDSSGEVGLGSTSGMHAEAGDRNANPYAGSGAFTTTVNIGAVPHHGAPSAEDRAFYSGKVHVVVCEVLNDPDAGSIWAVEIPVSVAINGTSCTVAQGAINAVSPETPPGDLSVTISAIAIDNVVRAAVTFTPNNAIADDIISVLATFDLRGQFGRLK